MMFVTKECVKKGRYMLKFIQDMPAHVVGIHAVDEVTKEDIEQMLIPRLDDMVKEQGEINYLLVLETEVKKFTIGAILKDILAGLKYYTKWRKIAIVSEQKSIMRFSNIFGYFIPGKSKGFPLAKLDEAVIWISAKD